MPQKCVLSLLLTGIAALAFSADAPAQGWRGLAPMRSTCQDVEKVLGGTACGKEQAIYDLPGESVWFNFSVDGCKGGHLQEEYDVPTGTIIGISISMRGDKLVTLSDLKVDLTKFEKTDISDMIGVYKYISREVGMYITANEGGMVGDYAYVPPSSYDNLRCPPPPQPTSSEERKMLDAPVLVGSFDPASQEQESQILGQAIQKLKEYSGQKDQSKEPDGLVWVIAHAREGTPAEESKLIAERVRDRLVAHYKIDRSKVIAIGGGHRRNAEVVISIQPLVTPTPKSPHPSDQL